MDRGVRVREVDRRAARSADTPRPHPRIERRQLSPQTEQAAPAADISPTASQLATCSLRAAAIGPQVKTESRLINRTGKLSSGRRSIVRHFYFDPPMHLLSGVDTIIRSSRST